AGPGPQPAPLAGQAAAQSAKAGITSRAYGKTTTGTPVTLYTLTNAHGLEAQIINYGGIIVSLKTPDRPGKFAALVLGFRSLEPYPGPHPNFGALIGRYGNRIGKATFSLEGKTYTL